MLLNTPKLTPTEILADHDNTYRAVVGIFPTKTELSKWTTEKFSDFYKWTDWFYNAEKGKDAVNSFTIGAMNAYCKKNPDHVWNEFWHRTAFKMKNGDWDGISGNARYMIMVRVVNNYVKANPVVLSQETIDSLKKKKNFSWVLECFKDTTLRIGAEIVEVSNKGITGTKPDNMSRVESPEKRLLEAMGKIANIYEMVASSITKKQIESMSVKDKIAALQKLSYVHQATRNFKPNSIIFNKINIHKDGREELEKAILDFSNES